MKVSEAIVNFLEKMGVRVFFGIPGGAIVPLLDRLSASGIRGIRMASEQGAIFAAQGYAKASREIGLCIATSGPGATNFTTGMANAFLDGTPVLCITGQAPRKYVGKNSFQEVDICSVFAKISAFSTQIWRKEDVAPVFGKLRQYLLASYSGPVHIDIPVDVFNEEVIEFNADAFCSSEIDFTSNDVEDKFDADVRLLIRLLKKAKKPVIVAGGGILYANASQELAKLANVLSIPVVTSLIGKGCFSNESRLYGGFIGQFGNILANKLVSNADFLLTLGFRFSNRSIVNYRELENKIIFDVNLKENLFTPVNYFVESDVKRFLLYLLGHLKNENIRSMSRRKYLQEINQLRKVSKHAFDQDAQTDGHSNDISPRDIVKVVDGLVNEDTIIVTEVGHHQMVSAHYLHSLRPNSLITSGGLGAMGFGLPAAIGAKTALPHKKVLLLAGDGSFLMNCTEISTAVQNMLDISIILFKNNTLGMTYLFQKREYNGRSTCSKLADAINYEDMVRSLGGQAHTVRRACELPEAIKSIMDRKGVNLLVCNIDREQFYLPVFLNSFAQYSYS